MNEENGQERSNQKYKCEYCGVAKFDTAMQLRGHQMKCRPGSAKPDEEKKDEQQLEQMKKEQERQEPSQKRVPFGVPNQRFTDISNDGYHYRVFNDNWRKEPGRIQRALQAGYEVVEHPQSGGTVGTNEDGSEIKGILMRIPQEMWEQDQAVKEKKRAVVDEQIYQGQHTARRGDGRYVPNEGIRIENKLTP